MTSVRWPLLIFVLLSAAISAAGQEAPRTLRPGRLYFGAPPTVPHPLTDSVAACLVCHAGAAATASKMPHANVINCLQCHVPRSEETPAFRNNTMKALTRPAARTEKVTSPPAMAHPILLHEDCAGCHSPAAKKDVTVSPHPERQRCQLCHKPQGAPKN